MTSCGLSETLAKINSKAHRCDLNNLVSFSITTVLVLLGKDTLNYGLSVVDPGRFPFGLFEIIQLVNGVKYCKESLLMNQQGNDNSSPMAMR